MAGRRRGRLRRAVNDLTELLKVTRRVSWHDPDARPIAKGQLGRPVQFGYKTQVVDNEDGVVLDHNIEQSVPQPAR